MQSQYLRNTKPLSAEMIAVLMVLRGSRRALLQAQVEATLGPKGKRVSVAESFDYLEDKAVQFIGREQPPPKTARFRITEEGNRAIEAHKDRAIRDLEARIAKMKQPHSRDGSVMDRDLYAPFEHLLACLKAGKFGQTPTVEEIQFEAGGEGDEVVEGVQDLTDTPVRPAPAKRPAAPQAMRQAMQGVLEEGESDPDLEAELGGEDEAPGIDKATAPKPAKLGTRKNRIARSVKPVGGRRKATAAA